MDREWITIGLVYAKPHVTAAKAGNRRERERICIRATMRGPRSL